MGSKDGPDRPPSRRLLDTDVTTARAMQSIARADPCGCGYTKYLDAEGNVVATYYTCPGHRNDP